MRMHTKEAGGLDDGASGHGLAVDIHVAEPTHLAKLQP